MPGFYTHIGMILVIASVILTILSSIPPITSQQQYGSSLPGTFAKPTDNVSARQSQLEVQLGILKQHLDEISLDIQPQNTESPQTSPSIKFRPHSPTKNANTPSTPSSPPISPISRSSTFSPQQLPQTPELDIPDDLSRLFGTQDLASIISSIISTRPYSEYNICNTVLSGTDIPKNPSYPSFGHIPFGHNHLHTVDDRVVLCSQLSLCLSNPRSLLISTSCNSEIDSSSSIREFNQVIMLLSNDELKIELARAICPIFYSPLISYGTSLSRYSSCNSQCFRINELLFAMEHHELAIWETPSAEQAADRRDAAIVQTLLTPIYFGPHCLVPSIWTQLSIDGQSESFREQYIPLYSLKDSNDITSTLGRPWNGITHIYSPTYDFQLLRDTFLPIIDKFLEADTHPSEECPTGGDDRIYRDLSSSKPHVNYGLDFPYCRSFTELHQEIETEANLIRDGLKEKINSAGDATSAQRARDQLESFELSATYRATAICSSFYPRVHFQNKNHEQLYRRYYSVLIPFLYSFSYADKDCPLSAVKHLCSYLAPPCVDVPIQIYDRMRNSFVRSRSQFSPWYSPSQEEFPDDGTFFTVTLPVIPPITDNVCTNFFQRCDGLFSFLSQHYQTSSTSIFTAFPQCNAPRIDKKEAICPQASQTEPRLEKAFYYTKTRALQSRLATRVVMLPTYEFSENNHYFQYALYNPSPIKICPLTLQPITTPDLSVDQPMQTQSILPDLSEMKTSASTIQTVAISTITPSYLLSGDPARSNSYELRLLKGLSSRRLNMDDESTLNTLGSGFTLDLSVVTAEMDANLNGLWSFNPNAHSTLQSSVSIALQYLEQYEICGGCTTSCLYSGFHTDEYIVVDIVTGVLSTISALLITFLLLSLLSFKPLRDSMNRYKIPFLIVTALCVYTVCFGFWSRYAIAKNAQNSKIRLYDGIFPEPHDKPLALQYCNHLSPVDITQPRYKNNVCLIESIFLVAGVLSLLAIWSASSFETFYRLVLNRFVRQKLHWTNFLFGLTWAGLIPAGLTFIAWLSDVLGPLQYSSTICFVNSYSSKYNFLPWVIVWIPIGLYTTIAMVLSAISLIYIHQHQKIQNIQIKRSNAALSTVTLRKLKKNKGAIQLTVKKQRHITSLLFFNIFKRTTEIQPAHQFTHHINNTIDEVGMLALSTKQLDPSAPPYTTTDVISKPVPQSDDVAPNTGTNIVEKPIAPQDPSPLSNDEKSASLLDQNQLYDEDLEQPKQTQISCFQQCTRYYLPILSISFLLSLTFGFIIGVQIYFVLNSRTFKQSAVEWLVCIQRNTPFSLFSTIFIDPVSNDTHSLAQSITTTCGSRPYKSVNFAVFTLNHVAFAALGIIAFVIHGIDRRIYYVWYYYTIYFVWHIIIRGARRKLSELLTRCNPTVLSLATLNNFFLYINEQIRFNLQANMALHLPEPSLNTKDDPESDLNRANAITNLPYLTGNISPPPFPARRKRNGKGFTGSGGTLKMTWNEFNKYQQSLKAHKAMVKHSAQMENDGNILPRSHVYSTEFSVQERDYVGDLYNFNHPQTAPAHLQNPIDPTSDSHISVPLRTNTIPFTQYQQLSITNAIGMVNLANQYSAPLSLELDNISTNPHVSPDQLEEVPLSSNIQAIIQKHQEMEILRVLETKKTQISKHRRHQSALHPNNLGKDSYAGNEPLYQDLLRQRQYYHDCQRALTHRYFKQILLKKQQIQHQQNISPNNSVSLHKKNHSSPSTPNCSHCSGTESNGGVVSPDASAAPNKHNSTPLNSNPILTAVMTSQTSAQLTSTPTISSQSISQPQSVKK